jgi:membrane protein DedA with SNARE-associated domain
LGDLDDRQLSHLRTAVFALLSVVTAASLLGTALSPYLLVRSPLLLVAVSPAAHHVVLAAASVEPVPLVAVATARRVLTCIGAYGIGLLYGRAALGWLDQRYPRVARLVAWVEGLFAHWGVWLLVLIPVPTVALFAGAARSRLVAFLIAVTLGHTLWNTVTVFVGDAIARWTDRLTTFLGEHLLESTLLCVAVVALQQLLARRGARRRRESDVPLPPS